ncbi:helix-turn-helix domain-containing protein [Marinospirillum sp. MEB164]|uniref:Helix-turn-helix domain-containing protein n=1 Tax=Marinospirillum alkalitolerans TaxID=3123374 RepID=A0ABW8PVD5_9GAMM
MAKPRAYSEEQRAKVLALRQSGYSVKQVAEMMGLPEGTVKTITRRDTAILTNPQHRDFFRLPEPAIGSTGGTHELAVVEPPPQRIQTGDKEVDAILWLREMIQTGQPALIEHALAMASRLDEETLRAIESRYAAILASQRGALVAAFSSMGFCNLEGLARGTLEKKKEREAAVVIFGEGDYFTTPQEQFCIDALAGLETDRLGCHAPEDVESRFIQHKNLLPWTLADCVRELQFWRELDRHKYALFGCELDQATYARENFIRLLMTRIRARDKTEVRLVWEYVVDQDLQADELNPIVENLLGIR